MTFENMANYITNIKIHKLLDKSDLSISTPADGSLHHIILTGPNGAGKTTLFNAIQESLNLMFTDTNYNFKDYRRNLAFLKTQLEEAVRNNDTANIQQRNNSINYYGKCIEKLWGTVELDGVSWPEVFPLVRAHKYVIAFFGAERLSHFIEIKNPVKPNLEQSELKSSKTEEFIKFLVDLKFQQSMATNEGDTEEANEIGAWFEQFEDILRSLFADESLKLVFDYKHYRFYIEKSGARFALTDLSAGYSSALDIVADIILKMQDADHVVRAYDVPGIVFIDEVETHLHLKLQREILPFLTTLFPRIQFVVTTHSPFVLSSIENATIYDLAAQKSVDDLSDYSFEILAEGYFGVETESGKLLSQIERLEELANMDERSLTEEDDLRSLISDFEKIPEIIAPELKIRFYEVKRRLLQQKTDSGL